MRLRGFSLCLLLSSLTAGCAGPARVWPGMELCDPSLTTPGAFSCIDKTGKIEIKPTAKGLICEPEEDLKAYNEICHQ